MDISWCPTARSARRAKAWYVRAVFDGVLGDDAQGGLDNAIKRVRVGEDRRHYRTGITISRGARSHS